MVGTVTESSVISDGYIRTVLTWTSDASGNATYTTTEKFTGQLLSVTHIPNTGGTAPTDDYDVTVLDDAGVDLLGATGTDVTVPGGAHSTAISSGLPFTPVVDSTLALVVANAGNAKGGQVVLMFKGTKRK